MTQKYLIDKVREALSEVAIADQLKKMLEDANSPEFALEARNYFNQQREEFLSVVNDVGEGEDLDLVLATRYIEQKAHWIQLNIQLQYQAVIRGQADQAILYRASMLTFLLSQIEPLINRSYIDSINELLNKRLS